ncbi:MAG: urease accessory protein UreF [Oscillospiraceae bacterium]|nr:urease accessory protein UreF [Oscillospiraceae bacterium]
MNENQLFILLQVNDAQFPIGGYSHSYGLETYIQKNIVKDPETALAFMESNIMNSFLYSELLPARLAYEYAQAGELDKILELEEIVEASKSPVEIRSAAQKLGSRFIKTVVSMDCDYVSDIFTKYVEAVEKSDSQPTHATAYGVFCAAVGIEQRRAMESYLYTNTAGKLVSCVKTIPLSQTQGQQILKKCHPIFIKALDKLATLTEEQLCLSNPGFDVRCMQHEVLYSRLYMS